MHLYLKMDEGTYQSRVANFISIYFLMFALNLLVKIILGNFAGWEYISMCILGILLFLTIIAMPNTVKATLVVCEIGALVIFTFSYLMGYQATSFASIVFNVLVVYIPMAVSLYGMNDYELLLYKLYKFSWPAQLILIYVLLNAITRNNYLMSGGYALLFQALIVLDSFCERRKWYDFIVAIIDVFIIFVYGSRGPLICLGFFIILKLVFSKDTTKTMKIIHIVTTILAVCFMAAFYRSILELLINLVEVFGLRSRTLSYLLSNNFFELSGRDGITNNYIQRISQRPIFGWGVGGGWINGEDHPHNIIIEIILSFGYPIGILIFTFIVFQCVRGVFRKDDFERRVAHILLSYCVCLFMSSSFLFVPQFFLCMAICMKKINQSQSLESWNNAKRY